MDKQKPIKEGKPLAYYAALGDVNTPAPKEWTFDERKEIKVLESMVLDDDDDKAVTYIQGKIKRRKNKRNSKYWLLSMLFVVVTFVYYYQTQ